MKEKPGSWWPPLTSLALALAVSGCECGEPMMGPDGGDRDSGGTDGAVVDGGGPGDATTQDAGCVVRCGPAALCCGAGEECVFDRCLPACPGSRCADETMCCGLDELCVGAMCITPGAPCADESDCGEMETCEPLVRRCIPIPPGSVCRYVPPSGVFDPEIEWQWADEGSIAIPLVLQLTDDDASGTIDGRDIPDVVALTYPSSLDDARITTFSGDDGHVLFQSDDAINICGGTSPAAADLDGDGTVEIVVILSNGSSCGGGGQNVAAFSHTGALEWRSTATVTTRYYSVAIGDLDADGSPEIVAGGSVFSATGTFLWSQPELGGILGGLATNAPSLQDVDGDGRMEVIASNVVFNDDGSVLWRGGSVANGYTAVARVIDSSPLPGPQIVAVNQTTLQILDGLTGTSVFGPVVYETSGILAGPPTVADFDGDGRPEVGVAGDNRYVVFDPDLAAPPYIRWFVPSEDSSTGSVGSTVFDFDADGSAEVIYADECHVRILSGVDGSVVWYASNTSATALEFPVVADVDADGNAELIVVSNSRTASCASRSLPFDGGTQGVRVFRDRLDNWVPTRSIWNQHTYHLDNVRDDGTLPLTETPSWSTHNTYRLNTLLDPDAVTQAPDLVIVAHDALVGSCPVTAALRARVENRGSRGVPAGVQVAFFAGDPPDRSMLLGVGRTTGILLAGAGEWVEITATDLPLDAMRALRFYAVVDDDGTGVGAHSECMEGNNVGMAITFDCSGPI